MCTMKLLRFGVIAALLAGGASCAAQEAQTLPRFVARVLGECGIEVKERPVVATVQVEPGRDGGLYVLLHRERRLLLFGSEALQNRSKPSLLLMRDWSLDKDVLADPGTSTYILSERELGERLRIMLTRGQLVVLP